jgi:cystathionine beta-synthase
MPDQFHTSLNPLAHYSWLGPEIWSQTNGKITHFFAAAGSGGTVSGVGKFLKERNPEVKVYAVDAAGSFFSTKGKPRPYALDGMGLDAEWPTFDTSVIDEVIAVSDDEGFSMMRDLPHAHGILAGPSSGAAAAAVHQSLSRLSKGDIVVMIFGDSGRAYFSKGYFL